jgi:hypothetical protein
MIQEMGFLSKAAAPESANDNHSTDGLGGPREPPRDGVTREPFLMHSLAPDAVGRISP